MESGISYSGEVSSDEDENEVDEMTFEITEEEEEEGTDGRKGKIKSRARTPVLNENIQKSCEKAEIPLSNVTDAVTDTIPQATDKSACGSTWVNLQEEITENLHAEITEQEFISCNSESEGDEVIDLCQ